MGADFLLIALPQIDDKAAVMTSTRQEVLIQSLRVESRALAAQASRVARPGSAKFFKEFQRLYHGGEPALMSRPFDGLADLLNVK